MGKFITRQQSYYAIAIALTLSYVLMRGSSWHGSVQLHTLMEVLATVLALMVAAMALVNYYSRGESKFLVIGAGFIGTAFLDGYHAVVTSIWFKDNFPSDLSSLIPWSWVASRLFLGVLLYVSWLVWKKEQQSSFKISAKPVFLLTALATIVSFIFFAFVPLPRAYYPEFVFHRPEEFLPALFFILALFGYLKKGEWKSDHFEHWLVIAIIVNLVAQLVFMSFSAQIFDIEFDMAHLLKKVSYLCVLTGLLFGMYERFQDVIVEAGVRQKAQDSLIRSEARQRAIFTTMIDGVITINEKGIIESFNKGAENIFGYRILEVLGKNISMLMPEPHSNNHDDYIKQYMSTGESKVIGNSLELMGLKKDGVVFPIELVVGEMSVGKEKKFHGLIRDITDRKRVEAELIHARMEAEHAANAKSNFLATMSHEIRTPMNGVLGMIELLRGTTIDEKQRDYLETAMSSGNSLLSIINDILDFSKIEAGKLELEPIDFSLERLTNDIAHLLNVKADEKHIELIHYYHPGTPQFFTADAGRIRQVLLNLVGNAVKFTSKGFVKMEISLTNLNDDHCLVKFEIKDTGIGIEKSAQEKLFESFTQADDSTSRRFGGTGLGLAICKKLVDIMGGNISVDSEPGKGATFSFTLDLRLAKPPSELPRIDLQGIRALIVDDNETNLKILHEQLTSWGVLVDETSLPYEAMNYVLEARLDSRSYDLVIIDNMMPGLSGEELGRKIKSNNELNNIPLILLTSSAQKGDARIFQEIGFSAYLTKPVLSETLKQALSRALAEEQNGVENKNLITRHSIKDEENAVGNKIKLTGSILLAEDVVVNQKVALGLLEKIGLQADVANNGLEVIEMWERKDYDLILMDCQMPQLDGYEATECIRKKEKDKHIIIVALTANALSTDRQKCIDCGMDDYIPKPYGQNELAEILQKWLPGGASEKPGDMVDEIETNNNTEEEKMDDSVLDYTIIESMRKAIGKVFDDLIPAYIEQSDGMVMELKEKLDEGDMEVVERHAHSLKSSSNNLGAVNLSEMSRVLEDDARAGKESELLANQIVSIEQEYESVKKALLEYQQEHI